MSEDWNSFLVFPPTYGVGGQALSRTWVLSALSQGVIDNILTVPSNNGLGLLSGMILFVSTLDILGTPGYNSSPQYFHIFLPTSIFPTKKNFGVALSVT